jgi:hypothetical protein
MAVLACNFEARVLCHALWLSGKFHFEKGKKLWPDKLLLWP